MSSTWIRFWIVIGLLGCTMFGLLSWKAHQVVSAEADRFTGCAHHTRTDCDSSPIWEASGWDLTQVQTDSAQGSSNMNQGLNEQGATSTVDLQQPTSTQAVIVPTVGANPSIKQGVILAVPRSRRHPLANKK